MTVEIFESDAREELEKDVREICKNLELPRNELVRVAGSVKKDDGIYDYQFRVLRVGEGEKDG